MYKTNENDHTIRYLLTKSLEGSINQEEIKTLDALIIGDLAARRYYVEYLHIHVTLRKLLQKDPASAGMLEDEILNDGLWQELARHEQTAESIICEPLPVEACSECVQKATATTRPHKISRFSVISIAASIAAVLLMVLYIKLVPLPQPLVATLTDSINAKWSDGRSRQTGEGIRAETQRLDSGMISLTFESGAQVVVEGPAEFTPLSSNKMNLAGGKAFARVSNKALGFVIDTPQSSVVDLGTAFGVMVHPHSGSEVHVYEGKVNLIAGLAGQTKKSEILLYSQARKVDAGRGEMTSAEFKEYLFAQKISSRDNKIVYGPPVDLTAFLPVGSNPDDAAGIDPATGQVHQSGLEYFSRTGSGAFSRVADKIFVDGVFVPNGQSVVTSAGHAFLFPMTSGGYWSDITCTPFFDHGQMDEQGNVVNHEWVPAALHAAQEGTEPAMILMHANAGITFDLNKVRRTLKDAQIVRFKAFCGVSQNVFARMRHDYFILLDGQPAWNFSQVNEDLGIESIDIPIRPDQSYLTLAVTDGGDNTSFDWCIFENPILEVIPQ